MWLTFWLAFALASVLLVVPGALLLFALGARPTVALGSAPLVSVVLYGALGILFALLGVPASTALMVVPPLLLGAVLLAWRLRPARRPAPPGVAQRHELAAMGACVLVGVAVTGLVLVANLPTPDSFVEAWDNVAHFNMVRSMEQSRVWSTLSVTYYPGASAAIDPLPSAAHYYPEGWHLIAVMLVDALGVSVTCAANAVNAAACAVVMPAGVYLMLLRVFGREPRVAALGALVCLAFPSIPWNLIPRWTLYPNLFSFALLPTVIASFMGVAARGVDLRARVISGVVFVVGGAALYLAQPNSVFSAAVFLAPWCGWRIFEWRRGRGERRRRATAWVALWAAFVVALWAVMLNLPFLAGVVGYYWPPVTSFQNAVDGVFDLSFGAGPPRYALRLLVVVGFVSACVTARLRWLVVPFSFSALAFVVAGGIDTPLKTLLAGFWYTDPYRMAAMAALFAVPLAARGLYEFVRCGHRLFAGHPRADALVSPVLIAVFAVGLYLPALRCRLGVPASSHPDNFYALAQEMAEKNDTSRHLGYDAEKIAFVERALEVTGRDAVVLNQPYDGSAYAYGVSGMNVYWRYMSGYGASDEDGLESEASRVLRTRLAAGLAGTDPLARQAIEESGAEYVLVLDRDQEEMAAAFKPYVDADWAGFLALDDSNPGVEVVLAEGDMRLYRIV
ncbi:hypothetical protein H6A07_08150 [Olsenella uli]|uniref:DUF6541 family protein n=1 Tax=Olsenella uli TaxID=133926 RepID=UPI00195A9BAA|nr:DUF6541 family protein [Olsenella uli]MBM6676712.1 hypothetical protein [Olsenella uli]